VHVCVLSDQDVKNIIFHVLDVFLVIGDRRWSSRLVYNKLSTFLKFFISIWFSYAKQIIDETLRAAILGTFAGRYANKDMEIGGHLIPNMVL